MIETTDFRSEYTAKEWKRGEKGDVSLFGAFARGQQIRFVFSPGKGFPVVRAVWMVIHADGMENPNPAYREIALSPADEAFCVVVDTADLCRQAGTGDDGLFYYHYRVELDDDRRIFFGGEAPTELCEINGYDNERQLSVYAADFTVSERLKSGMIYHIFVDRFKKSARGLPCKPGAALNEDWDAGIPQFGEYPGAEVANNVFFGGDLYGIAEELSYVKALGVSTIYLSPVFDAASNHKYDTGDYLAVDSMFGGESALRELCAAARKLDIDVILDGVFNHTGCDSVYFNKFGNYPGVGAYQSKDSPYYSWYFFNDFPDDYECWWGVKILPRVNTASEDYRRFIYDQVIDRWMRAGVSGWRLDVADELDDDFLTGLRQAIKRRNADAAIIGEVWEDASDKVSYGRRRHYLRGRQLDSVMNYPLRDAILSYVLHGDVEKFRKNTETLYRRYPKEVSDSLMNFLGTHDTARILSVLGDRDFENLSNEQLSTRKLSPEARREAVRLLKLAYGLLVAMPGVPCIFYGDEVGMEGYRDPFCRKPFPWSNMDEDLLAYYRKLGEIRKRESVFHGGLFRLLSVSKDYAVMERYDDGDCLKIVANRSDEEILIRLSAPATDLISGKFFIDVFPVPKKSVVYIRETRGGETEK